MAFAASTERAEQMLTPGSGAALRAGAAMHGAVEGAGSIVHLPAAWSGAPFAVTGSPGECLGELIKRAAGAGGMRLHIMETEFLLKK